MTDRKLLKPKFPFQSIAVVAALLIACGALASMTRGRLFGSVAQFAPNGQSADGPIPDAPYVRFTEILGTLNLTSSEQAKISAVLLALHKKNAFLTDSGQRHANATIANAAIAAILSPDQRSDLQAKLEARPPHPVTPP